VLNKIKNISFLKIAGIKKLIVLELLPGYIKLLFVINKDPLYKIINTSSPMRIKIVHSVMMKRNGDLFELKTIIKSFIENNKIDTKNIIIGINEFRLKNIVIPSDNDDLDFWFEENSDKFLPLGKTIDKFSFAREKINTNEEYVYYSVVVSRRSYINELKKICEQLNLSLLNISPFEPATIGHHREDSKLLFINLIGERITYVIVGTDGNPNHGELYTTIYDEDNSINFEQIKFGLTELFSLLNSDTHKSQNADLEILLQSNPENYNELKNIVNSIFHPVSINQRIEKENYNHIASLSTAEKLYRSFDESYNLLEQSKLSTDRDEMEKQLTLKTVIISGFFLITMLLGIYLTESFVSNKLKADEDNLIEVSAQKDMIDKYEKENSFLKSNLSHLSNLKGNRITYSNLFNEIPRFVSDSSCFIGLNIKELNSNIVELDFQGLALTQTEVAHIMQKIETNSNFNKISLMYANSIDKKNIKLNVPIKQNKLINFKLRANYDAN